MYLLFHAMVCHILVNDTVGRGLEKKMTKCDIVRGGDQKCHLANDTLFD